MRFLRAFGRFWWDFLIGDTPELFVGTLIILGAIFTLGRGSAFAPYLLVILVGATIGVSVWVEMRRVIKRTRK